MMERCSGSNDQKAEAAMLSNGHPDGWRGSGDCSDNR